MVRKQRSRKQKSPNGSRSFAYSGIDGGCTQQESEYQNLLKRVEAHKDAEQIKRIAERINKENE